MATTLALLAFLALLLENLHLFARHLLGVLLQLHVERRVDGQPLAPDVERVVGGVVLLFQLFEHIERKVGRREHIETLGYRRAQRQFLLEGGVGLWLGDVARFDHSVQGHTLAAFGILRDCRLG
jgi:hypothetical protein